MMVTLMRDGRDRCAGRKFLGNRSASESGRPRVHNWVNTLLSETIVAEARLIAYNSDVSFARRGILQPKHGARMEASRLTIG